MHKIKQKILANQIQNYLNLLETVLFKNILLKNHMHNSNTARKGYDIKKLSNSKPYHIY